MSSQARTILCGVDGSDASVQAVRVGDALGTAMDAHLVLAHVGVGGAKQVPVPYPVTLEDEDSRSVIDDAAERAGVTSFRARPVEAGSVAGGLIAAARVENPSLIVVGSGGHSLLHEVVLGSVAGQLPLQAPCPVVVTPADARIPGEHEPLVGPQCLVCGIEDSDEAETATRIAGLLARALDARLVLTHARSFPALAARPALSRHSVGPAEDAFAEREQQLSAQLIERAATWSAHSSAAVEPAMEMGEPAERIEAVAEREDADLIVVGSRGRGALRAAVLGSTSRALGARARRPVIIVGPCVET